METETKIVISFVPVWNFRRRLHPKMESPLLPILRDLSRSRDFGILGHGSLATSHSSLATAPDSSSNFPAPRNSRRLVLLVLDKLYDFMVTCSRYVRQKCQQAESKEPTMTVPPLEKTGGGAQRHIPQLGFPSRSRDSDLFTSHKSRATSHKSQILITKPRLEIDAND